MKKVRIFFQPVVETWRNGYLIPIRNRFSNHLQREYIPNEFKDNFLSQFGEKIIFDDQFIKWYSSVLK